MSPIRIETGPMFSGKSSSMIKFVENFLRAERKIGRDILVFNHASDERYGTNQISSHNQTSVEAFAVRNSQEIFEQIFDFDSNDTPHIKKELEEYLTAIFIDEAQFFDDNLPLVVQVIDSYGIDVYLAGLDTNFKGETFGPMGDLMAIADTVNKNTAVCMYRTNGHTCGEPAQKTQRLVNGKPANYDDPIILVGAHESYTARCKDHHQVPGRPGFGKSK